MNDEIHSQPEEKQSVLRIILRLLLGLAGIGLISLAGFAGFISIAIARNHGGNTGDVFVFYLVMAAIGAALLVCAKRIGRRKEHVERR